jgi:hypothetical protein
VEVIPAACVQNRTHVRKTISVLFAPLPVN